MIDRRYRKKKSGKPEGLLFIFQKFSYSAKIQIRDIPRYPRVFGICIWVKKTGTSCIIKPERISRALYCLYWTSILRSFRAISSFMTGNTQGRTPLDRMAVVETKTTTFAMNQFWQDFLTAKIFEFWVKNTGNPTIFKKILAIFTCLKFTLVLLWLRVSRKNNGRSTRQRYFAECQTKRRTSEGHMASPYWVQAL